MTVTADEVKIIAEEAADAAVRKMFEQFGVDLSSPESIIKFQDDMRHLRTWRESTELIKRQGLKSAVGFIVAGLLGYFVLAFQRH